MEDDDGQGDCSEKGKEDQKKEKHECSKCGRKCKHRQHLWRHEKEHSNDNDEQFKCTCGKDFSRKDNFQRHLRVCKGGKLKEEKPDENSTYNDI